MICRSERDYFGRQVDDSGRVEGDGRVGVGRAGVDRVLKAIFGRSRNPNLRHGRLPVLSPFSGKICACCCQQEVDIGFLPRRSILLQPSPFWRRRS
jgi:hypothetical protein